MPTWSETPGWDEFKRAMVDGRTSPGLLAAAPGDPLPEPVPHGLFRSHLDLPHLTAEECARMEPVWDAIYGLVSNHPDGCGCDPAVMAWRAAYATAEILLRLPDANGMFRRRYVGDSEYIYGWRCYRHGQPIERHGKAWDANSARKSYEAHMEAKHSTGEGADVPA